MNSYSVDKQLKFGYDQQNHKVGFDLNAIGPQELIAIPLKDYTDTDSNTIYFDTSTGNDGNPGTNASPKLTFLASINACTLTKTKVIILNSTTVSEELDSVDNNYFEGVYADTGVTAYYTTRVLPFTPTNDNIIAFSQDFGDDTTGDGTIGNPYATMVKVADEVDADHQYGYCLDSATYEEPGLEFTGNLKGMISVLGETPTYKPLLLNYNITQQDIISLTDFSDNKAVSFMDSVILPDGRIFIAYSDNTGAAAIGKYIVLNSDYSSYITPTIFHNAKTYEISTSILPGGEIFIAYKDGDDGSKGKYIVLDTDYSVLVAETIFHNAITGAISTDILTGGEIFIAYSDGDDGNKGKYIVLDTDYSVLVAETIFHNAAIGGVSVTIDLNDRIFIAYEDAGDGNKGKYIVLNSDYSSYIAETIFHNAAISFCSSYIFPEGEIFLCYNDDPNLATWNGYYIVFDIDYSTLVSEVNFIENVSYGICCCIENNGKIFIAISDHSDSENGNYCIINFISDSIKISTDSIFNGFKFEFKYYNIQNLFKKTAKLTAKYCDFFNITNYGHTSKLSNSNASLDIQNCSWHDNDAGFYTENNTVTIKNNLAYRNTQGYAIHVKGAGAGIDIQHNSTYVNQSDIYLENNNGSEVVKNNIHNDSLIYDVKATTNITVTNSIIKSNKCLNVILGSLCTSANPLYVNEGEYDPDDIDLHLWMRILGYSADSPAYQLADDIITRNAGAYNTIYIGGPPTYTYFTTIKPIKVNISYIPENAIRNVAEDGTIETSLRSITEHVEIPYDGLEDDDFQNMLTMLDTIVKGANSRILVFTDPITYPDNYNIYSIVFEDYKGSPVNYRLSVWGVQDFALVFEKVFSL